MQNLPRQAYSLTRVAALGAPGAGQTARVTHAKAARRGHVPAQRKAQHLLLPGRRAATWGAARGAQRVLASGLRLSSGQLAVTVGSRVRGQGDPRHLCRDQDGGSLCPNQSGPDEETTEAEVPGPSAWTRDAEAPLAPGAAARTQGAPQGGAQAGGGRALGDARGSGLPELGATERRLHGPDLQDCIARLPGRREAGRTPPRVCERATRSPVRPRRGRPLRALFCPPGVRAQARGARCQPVGWQIPSLRTAPRAAPKGRRGPRAGRLPPPQQLSRC